MFMAIPVDIDQHSVCPVFARAPYFLIFDTETEESRLAENPAADAEGGAGPKAAQFIVDQEIDVLITPRLGENAAKVCSLAEIRLYKTQSKDAMENIRDCMADKLEPLTQFHAGYHGVM